MAQISAVVIGASAGGLEALTAIVRHLPSDLCAAVLVVMHTRAQGKSYLDRIIGRDTALPVAFAIDGGEIKPGHIYVAPPDLHLTVNRGAIELTHGPKENGFRPAVDPLFRSAARWFGDSTVGVVLSGALDDGTYGLQEIKESGGLAVVQNPAEASHPGMPLSALRFVTVDHVLNAAAIAGLIVELCQSPEAISKGERGMARQREPDPQNPAEETDVKEMEQQFGKPSGLTCPDCGGALWMIQNGELTRYRCHVGHQFTTEGLDAGQTDAVEEALWSAVRILEEHADLRRHMAERADGAGLTEVASGFTQSAAESHRQAHTIRGLLFGRTAPAETDSMSPPRSLRRKAKKRKMSRRAR